MDKNTTGKNTTGAQIVVSKPFLTGKAVDSSTLKSALMVFGSLFVVAIVYLIVCGVMNFDIVALRLVLNGLVVFATLAIYYSAGMSQGSIAVNNGEIMYHRRETGAKVSDDELSRCYHPAKGFVSGLAGTLPFFMCALVLALIAKRQVTGLGALPTWVSSLETREEIGAPLAFYHEGVSLGLEGVLRIIVRLLIMPYVNMVGANNPDGLLILERVSPLLILLPGVFYGIGYTRGVQVRAKVHTDIARNTRKRAKKNQKAKKKPVQRGTIELN
ncbi:MAG: hypothetical protein IJ708_02235 [Clostridia bacterium]|nr:hypothetical protein [Clostridia bacterium]